MTHPVADVATDLSGEVPARLARAVQACAEQGLDALLITPGPDLRYLTGYPAPALERLTCLVLSAAGEARLVVPELELLAASVAGAGIELVSWGEDADPYELVADICGHARRVGLDSHMWAEKVLRLRWAMGRAEQLLASSVLGPLRAGKSSAEVVALMRAGAAIDSVHRQVPRLLRSGRTEAEVAADIARMIGDSGHSRADFVIVASGPNAASPHHQPGDRVIQRGDPVVVDIGGTMPDGYCSDCTRMYCIGDPPAEWSRAYAVLQQAQAAGVAAAQVGSSCESVDAACRDVMARGGLADAFIHRTGHGIGLQTHEEPYIVAGNQAALVAGNAFSVEPGFYLPGRFGARIEDIVIATAEGPVRANTTSRDLVVIQP